MGVWIIFEYASMDFFQYVRCCYPLQSPIDVSHLSGFFNGVFGQEKSG